MLVNATPSNPAGWFASYHAYPYYPDFMLYDPGYSIARSPEGRSNYFGYLTALKKHHRGVPLLIAEYGVPSSRGIAHLRGEVQRTVIGISPAFEQTRNALAPFAG